MTSCDLRMASTELLLSIIVCVVVYCCDSIYCPQDGGCRHVVQLLFTSCKPIPEVAIRCVVTSCGARCHLMRACHEL